MAERPDFPRRLAVRVLTQVLSHREALDDALSAVIGEVPPSMKGWLHEVCSGTLRWKGRLDLALDSVSHHKKPSGWLRKILLVASYQLIAQDRIQPATVVSETVSEIKTREGEAPARFANACLRRIAEQAQQWRNLSFDPNASVPEAALWASVPQWMWQKWVNQKGVEWAKAYALASLNRPELWVRSRKTDWRPDWAEPGPIAYSWRSLQGGAVFEKEEFAQGEFFVQDISSQTLVTEVSTRVHQEFAGKEIQALDLCAAPGGKSIGMAWNGIHVTAFDRDEKRLQLLKQSLVRTHTEVEMIQKAQLDSLPLQDLVWVDAPCTGTGILRRHPDVRWLRQEKELSELTQIQAKLLTQGWEKLKPGGLLAYSVCSVLEEEGPSQIEKAALSGKKVLAKWFLCPQDPPYGDGFWMALLKKSD